MSSASTKEEQPAPDAPAAAAAAEAAESSQAAAPSRRAAALKESHERALALPALRPLFALEAETYGVARYVPSEPPSAHSGTSAAVKPGPRLVSRAVYPGLSGEGSARKTCQDMVHAARIEVQPGVEWLLVCLCDGHGVSGHKVVEMLRRLLPPLLQAEIRRRGLKKRHVKAAFAAAFKNLQRAVTAAAGAPEEFEYSGATATVLLLDEEGAKVHVAAIGDSRAVLALRPPPHGRLEYELLSHDHTFDDPQERVRARRNGGLVQQANGAGPLRLFEPGTNGPGLAVSRSFADTAAHRVGVTAEPEVKQFNVDGALHSFVVLASDGVWDKFENQEAVDLVAAGGDPAVAAKNLVEAAAARWIAQNNGRSDDISAVVVYLAPPEGAHATAAEAEADDLPPPTPQKHG